MVLQPSIQLDLFEMPLRGRDRGGTAVTGAGEEQVGAASAVTLLLTQPLMGQLCRHENLRRAYERVKANRGAPGVEGMTVEELGPWLVAHELNLVNALLLGTYRPQPLRSVEIDKPGGGKRLLRIPM
jgi:RNA-directed DNA polymerase